MAKSVIVVSNIKACAKFNEKELNVSKDFYEKLDEKVTLLVQEACRRAKENSRNTVMGRDL